MLTLLILFPIDQGHNFIGILSVGSQMNDLFYTCSSYVQFITMETNILTHPVEIIFIDSFTSDDIFVRSVGERVQRSIKAF